MAVVRVIRFRGLATGPRFCGCCTYWKSKDCHVRFNIKLMHICLLVMHFIIPSNHCRCGGWDGKKWLSDVYILDTSNSLSFAIVFSTSILARAILNTILLSPDIIVLCCMNSITRVDRDVNFGDGASC